MSYVEVLNAPQIIILSGPNGAGKSTSSPALVPDDIAYINADEIAKGLTDLDKNTSKDLEASRLLLQEWDRYAEQRTSFAIETTLASRSLAPKIRRLQESGYQFQLYYFWLPSPDLAISRVAERVKLGGHNIPEDIIRRRYEAGWRNFFEIYQALANRWEIYANLADKTSILVARGHHSQTKAIDNPTLWRLINKGTSMNENRVMEHIADYDIGAKERERAVQRAVRAALLQHKRAGNPIAIWRDEQVVWIPAEEIDVDEEDETVTAQA